MTAIRALPDPPSTTDPINFSSKADAHVLALQDFTTDVNNFAAQLESIGAISTTIDTIAATATTTPLWSYSKIQNWTGTPIITDLPDAPQAGASRIVYPTAGTTITNNANLIVQGGADYTTQANDALEIIAKTVSTFNVNIIKAVGYATKPYVDNLGYKASAIVAYSGTATVLASDVGKQAYFNSATDSTLTLPANSTVDTKVKFTLTNISTGACTVTKTGAAAILAFGQSLSSVVLLAGDSIELINDGTNWICVNSFINFKRTSDVTPVLVAGGGSYIVNHKLGRLPNSVKLEYICLTAEQGFSVYDVVEIVAQWNGSSASEFFIWRSTTQVGIKFSAGYVPFIRRKTDGDGFTPTAASWAYRFVIS